MGVKYSEATRLVDGAKRWLLGAERLDSATTTDYKIQHNVAASSDPTVNDDASAGYTAGVSTWFRLDTRTLWVCADASAGAAVWVKFHPSSLDEYLAGGHYYFPQVPPVNGASLVATAVQDAIKLFPFKLQKRITTDRLTYRVGTQNGNMAGVIYNSDPITKLPTTERGHTNSAAVGAPGATRDILFTSAIQLEAGVVYWAGLNCSAATATFTACGPGGISLIVGSQLDGSIGGSGTSNVGLSFASQTFGTWADLSAASFTYVTGLLMPCLGFKCSAVP